ncbi:MAG: glutaredoxin family protein [candidate division NC10 bacterium]|nr:glutaredoxin family protein [candidate division NC10 bacterium]
MFCHRTQEFLAQKGIAFENRDVTKDPQVLEELQKLGYATTPVILIDDEIVVGFDQRKLERLLGIA